MKREMGMHDPTTKLATMSVRGATSYVGETMCADPASTNPAVEMTVGQARYGI